MRPYAHGRNRKSAEWRKASLYGRVCVYLQPFVQDLHSLWELHLPVPTSAKAMCCVVVLMVMAIPVLYLPLLVLVTVTTLPTMYGAPPQLDAGAALLSMCRYRLTASDARRVLALMSDVAIWLSTLCTSWDYMRIFRDITEEIS